MSNQQCTSCHKEKFRCQGISKGDTYHESAAIIELQVRESALPVAVAVAPATSSTSHRELPRTPHNEVVTFYFLREPVVFTAKEGEPTALVSKRACTTVFLRAPTRLIVLCILAVTAPEGGTDIISNAIENKPPYIPPDNAVAFYFS